MTLAIRRIAHPAGCHPALVMPGFVKEPRAVVSPDPQGVGAGPEAVFITPTRHVAQALKSCTVSFLEKVPTPRPGRRQGVIGIAHPFAVAGLNVPV